MSVRQCANCALYTPNAPSDWKPGYHGQVFDLWAFFTYLNGREMPRSWPGQCRHDPTVVDVHARHYCAHWQINDNLILSWGRVMYDRANQGEADKLRQQLKAERERSLQRYRLLRTKTNGHSHQQSHDAGTR